MDKSHLNKTIVLRLELRVRTIINIKNKTIMKTIYSNEEIRNYYEFQKDVESIENIINNSKVKEAFKNVPLEELKDNLTNKLLESSYLIGKKCTYTFRLPRERCKVRGIITAIKGFTYNSIIVEFNSNNIRQNVSLEDLTEI